MELRLFEKEGKLQIRINNLFLIIAILIFLVSCGPKAKQEAKIGVVIPLSGEAADYGIRMKQGIDLAIERINQNGGINGRKVRVLYEDGQANPTRSVSAFKKLIDIDKVPAVLSGFSTVVLALAPIANQSKIVLLNCGATSPKIADAGPFVFSLIPLATQEASFLADYVWNKMQIKEIIIYWQNNDAGDGMRKIFKSKFESYGGKIIAELVHEQNQTDFKSDLLKIKRLPKAPIFAPTYSKELSLILKQARELGIDSLFIGYAATEVPTVIEIAGKSAEGVIYSYYSYDSSSNAPNVKDFVQKFKSRYGEEPNLYAATFYDGAMLLSEAFKKGAFAGEEIRNYLLSIENYNGITGLITFKGSNVASVPLSIKTIKDGKFIRIE